MERKNNTSAHTKQALAAALKELMAHKPVEKITIQELTAQCGIKRQNFYYHFEDIYDLMRWTFQEEAISLLQEFEGSLLWQEGILQLFQYLQNNKEVCLCALKSVGRDHIKRFFETDIHAIIYRTVEQMACEIGYTEDDKAGDRLNLLTHYFVVSLAGLMESWLLGELEQSPQELVAFFDLIFKDFIRGAELRIKEEDK